MKPLLLSVKEIFDVQIAPRIVWSQLKTRQFVEKLFLFNIYRNIPEEISRVKDLSLKNIFLDEYEVTLIFNWDYVRI